MPLVTWEVPSRFVDPRAVVLNLPPHGTPPRSRALRAGIVLPRGYDGVRRFPVLYLLHGHGDTYDTWAHPDFGDVLEIARDLEAIVVLPESGRGWHANWWEGGARIPGWERYHLDELVRLVEERLATRPGRRWRALAGLSMGGGGAAFYATQRPGLFGSVASFSGTLAIGLPSFPAHVARQGDEPGRVFGDREAQAFYWAGHDPAQLAGSLRHTRVRVAHGDGTPVRAGAAPNDAGARMERELLPHAHAFARAARAAGVDLTLVLGRGRHEWSTWRRNLGEAISWGLFEAVPEMPGRWTYATVAQHARAWDVTFDALAPPIEIMTAARDGRWLALEGAGDVRVRAGGTDRVVRLPARIRLGGGRPVAPGASPAPASTPRTGGTP